MICHQVQWSCPVASSDSVILRGSQNAFLFSAIATKRFPGMSYKEMGLICSNVN